MRNGSILVWCAAVAATMAAAGGTARAQQFGGYAPFNGFGMPRPQPGDRVPLRVQANYQIQVPFDRGANLDEQKTAIEAGHAALYDLAKRECDTLLKAFDGECRVVSLSVNNASQAFGPGTALPFNASATIEIVPRPPAPPPAAKAQ